MLHDARYNRRFPSQLVRDFEMRLQLANRDRDGMTAAMLGARSGNVSIVAALMTEIEETEVTTVSTTIIRNRSSAFLSLLQGFPLGVFCLESQGGGGLATLKGVKHLEDNTSNIQRLRK